jgi:hypothetical protein
MSAYSTVQITDKDAFMLITEHCLRADPETLEKVLNSLFSNEYSGLAFEIVSDYSGDPADDFRGQKWRINR